MTMSLRWMFIGYWLGGLLQYINPLHHYINTTLTILSNCKNDHKQRKHDHKCVHVLNNMRCISEDTCKAARGSTTKLLIKSLCF